MGTQKSGQAELSPSTTAWLLESNPWTRLMTLRDVLGRPPDSAEVRLAKKELLQEERVAELIESTQRWLETAPGRNSDAQLSYFKLRMLADFGLTQSDPGLATIVRKAQAHLCDGMFAVRGGEPVRQKGERYSAPDPKTEVWHAAPCNSPMISYALLRVGARGGPVMATVDKLASRWATEQGWFCHYFFVDGLFKKLGAGCPMAGLMALEVFSEIPALKESRQAQNAAAPLLYHRQYGKTLYYFGRSKRFWTLKYPFVWYNALYLAEVLTRFAFLRREPLVQELVSWLESQQDAQGRFTPTSIFQAYKGWDFADKKSPSPWITFVCHRILRRWRAGGGDASGAAQGGRRTRGAA